jgi:hypothetical protein
VRAGRVVYLSLVTTDLRELQWQHLPFQLADRPGFEVEHAVNEVEPLDELTLMQEPAAETSEGHGCDQVDGQLYPQIPLEDAQL